MFGYRGDGQSLLDQENLWTALPGVSENPFRVYCKLSYRGVDQMAIQPLVPLEADPLPQMAPWHSVPSSVPHYHHFSAVGLNKALKITPCFREVALPGGTFRAISGIMVHYANGSRACAGEFRMDRAGEAIGVDDTLILVLGFYAREGYARRWLVTIDTDFTDDCEGVTYKSVPLKGTLQWWLGDEGSCRMYNLDWAGQLAAV